jgi:streptomycin 6-kinase
MKTFEQNIISIYKDKGEKWLQDLPLIVKEIANNWQLTNLEPVSNLTFNYVLTGLQKDRRIILKISFDKESLSNEADALQAFQSYGAVRVLEQTDQALLLERISPAISLKTYLPKKANETREIICSVMKQLHEAPIPKIHNFPHIKDQLTNLDKDWQLPIEFLRKARVLRDKLLSDSFPLVLLHGDLHHDNVLSNGEGWSVIDPKGVIGYPINEVWAFIMDPIKDTEFVAGYFNFDLLTLRQWYFVHLMLAASWNCEDNLEPSLFLNLASKLERML